MRYTALFFENLRIAYQSIRSNLLRTILTILIIGIGITALVGILTSIDSLKSTLRSQFSSLGSSTFTIERKWGGYHGSSESNSKVRRRSKTFQHISYRQAMRFKEEFNFPAISSVMATATWTATAKYQSEKTDPNIMVIGVDENFLFTSGREILKGSNISGTDVSMFRNVAIIGSELAKTLFKKENPVDKVISIGNRKYKVIGVLKEKGSSFGGNEDKVCLVPISNIRQYFPYSKRSHSIKVRPNEEEYIDIAVGEAEGLMRIIRQLDVKEENSFKIEKSDELLNMFFDNMKVVTLSATIIGLITLFGAAIGLMNIMLVSVSERTREIGTRKAIGAKSKTIKQQFLFESVFIGQLGGIVGVFFGILIGNIVSLILKSPFIFPWIWVLLGVGLCFLVGVLSGYMPAVKASKLDPIDALRYE